MKKQLVAYGVAAAVLCGTVSVLAQAPPTPKPGPEHKVIEYFIGKWTGQAEVKPGPFGPGGKMTSDRHVRVVLRRFPGHMSE